MRIGDLVTKKLYDSVLTLSQPLHMSVIIGCQSPPEPEVIVSLLSINPGLLPM